MAAAALAAAHLSACAAPSRATLTREEILACLTQLGRDLFPHPSVADEKYRTLAMAFEADNAEVAAYLAGVLSQPHRLFEDHTATRRRALIEVNFGEASLQAYRFATLVGLYNDLDVTRHFGYQGPSIYEGGYLDRGFNDLDWLPNPT